jgi:ligand-binding SRPBCC domain-containing protein
MPARSRPAALARSRTRQRTAGAGSAAASLAPTKPVAPAMRTLASILLGYPLHMKVHLLERSQRVEIPIQRAFELYADSANLEPMTPPWLHFRLTSPGPVRMEPGALLDYTLRLHGVPIRWTTRIETWNPPTGFVDTQAKGPYSLWEHTHAFEEDPGGATLIHDRVRYAIPLGPIGSIAHRLFVRRDLERIFDYRAEALAQLVERTVESV